MARAALHGALVERFVPIDAGGYDDIRTMYERVQRAGLLDGTWHARWRAIAEARGQPAGGSTSA
jgi:hypothetical protein